MKGVTPSTPSEVEISVTLNLEGVVHRLHTSSRNLSKLSPHLGKWERCDLGDKHRARYCYLLLAPSFRLTPNDVRGVVPNKEFSMAQCLS